MMEEKHSGCMREVESLIDQFRVQVSKDQAPVENKTTKGMLFLLCLLEK